MKVEIRPAGLHELPELIELLQHSGLPVAGVEAHLTNYLVATKEGRMVGMVGLEIYGDVGLLRSLAVVPTEKRTGVGKELVVAILAKAEQTKLTAVFLLTTTAEEYFPRFGFRRIARGDLDERLEESEELRGACPDTAVCMRLRAGVTRHSYVNY